MDQLQILQKMTGESDTDLLSLLLQDAETFVLSYTNRSRMIPPLEKTVRDIAVISLNRMGTEGGESYSFESMPNHIYSILNRYRLARVGGVTHEAKTKQG